MVTVIIVDDEPKSIKNLKWELEHYCTDVVVAETFTGTHDAIRYLNSHAVDCVFLDVNMPEMDGFKFLSLFPKRDFFVIITTAYQQYAIKAIKDEALDYLLKPTDPDDLKVAIEKLQRHILEKERHSQLESDLEKALGTAQVANKKISVPCDGKIIFLDPNDISHCESDGNYCTVFMDNKDRILLTQKLKFMEEKLVGLPFFRVHNSFLINLNKVREFHKGDEYVILINNIKIPVSRSKKASFLNHL